MVAASRARQHMNLVLEPDGPLDVHATLARYRLWGEDPSNRLGEGVFRRVLRLGARLVPYEVRWSGGVDDARLTVRLPGARATRVGEAVAAEVRRVFGLDFDLAGFYRLAKGDPVLAALIEPLYGLRPTLAARPLEMLVHAIAAQQVNLPFAFVCRARLVRRYGTPVAIGGQTAWAFPAPATLAAARVRDLRRMQFSTRKAEYIRDLARAVRAGALDLEALATAPDAVVIERLTALRGLGRWTADWFLARCLGRGAVCPAGDLAVRKAFARHWGRGRTPSEAAIRRRAAAWGPHQNLAIHYLLAGMRLAAPATGGGT
ncbi:MAG: DNA-3-methyladenine glycosylase 2 family protein [Candidatus Rokubacteria bacterium]|nr:DNA-3-methyladenine glycosylase 2 family protein [Candidatus Rokubacteria bacterium]MBI3826995.1 DNA-3-methyladenine glycosylase 2 family protein [Candidatus Rokubacteria bacterium]